MRLLCISDIHGHADALSAVLATAERRGYDRLLVAGDHCFPGPQPLETIQRLTQLAAVCVQGVGDKALALADVTAVRPRDDHDKARLQRLLAVREELGPTLLRRLAKLPTLRHVPLGDGRQLTLVHGSPTDPYEPMTHDLDDRAVCNLLGDDPSELVLCGGSHLPFDRIVARAAASQQGAQTQPPRPVVTRVINLGSVGEAPNAGAGRHAHATFVERVGRIIEVESFVVPLGRAA